jgi:hypothetical protein
MLKVKMQMPVAIDLLRFTHVKGDLLRATPFGCFLV